MCARSAPFLCDLIYVVYLMGQKTLWVSCKHPYVSTGHNISKERGVNQNQNLALSVCMSYDPADL